MALHPCPCCKGLTIVMPGGYEPCIVCQWEDDPIQSDDPDFAGGANKLSLNEFRRCWLEKQRLGNDADSASCNQNQH